MRGDRPIGRQTEIILDLMDELRRLQSSRRQSKPLVDRQQRRDRRLAPVSLPDCAAAEVTLFCQSVDHWGWHGLIVRPGSSFTVPQA